MITGKDLIEAGFAPGRWFADAIAAANRALVEGAAFETALAEVARFAPPRALDLAGPDERPLHMNIEGTSAVEAANVEAVRASMRELLRTPVVLAGAVMPDACPAGSPGTIPVGGVAVSEAEVRAAQRWAAAKLRLVVEPGGAVAIAALLSGKVQPQENMLVLVSGGNADPAAYAAVLSGSD